MAKPATVTMTLDYPAGCDTEWVRWATNSTGWSKAALEMQAAYLTDKFKVRVAGLADIKTEFTGRALFKTPPFRVTITGALAYHGDDKRTLYPDSDAF